VTNVQPRAKDSPSNEPMREAPHNSTSELGSRSLDRNADMARQQPRRADPPRVGERIIAIGPRGRKSVGAIRAW